MPSFAELNIFNQIIQLSELKVKDYQFIEGFGLVLVVEKKEKKVTCSRCGKKSDRLHQNHEYLVRDLPHAEHQVYLKVNRRQLKCACCRKPFREYWDEESQLLIDRDISSLVNIKRVGLGLFPTIKRRKGKAVIINSYTNLTSKEVLSALRSLEKPAFCR